MSTEALVLVLTAAVVHAGWNVILGGSRDPVAATGVLLPAAIVIGAPVAAISWHVERSAWPYLAATSVFETIYILLLAAAYARADVSVVYPIARGSAPLIVLLVAGVPSPVTAVGVCLVAAGVVAVRGLRAPQRPGDLLLALAVGGSIAAYTLIDRSGIHHASAATYFEIGLFPPAVLCLAWAAYTGRLRAQLGVRTVVAGGGMFAAYTLVLAALRLAPAPAVAAVRESSVVFAAFFAGRGLGERVGAARLGGSAAVAAGVALIALG